VRIGFTGVPGVESRFVVPVGQKKDMAYLDASASPLLTNRDHAEITLVYVDRHENEYRLIIPVSRERRADGDFNMVIDWPGQRTVPPTLTKKRFREIGR
jgi:hypothetical protein